MCERAEATRELRRCAEALTLACVVSTGLAQLYDGMLAEPVPATISTVLDSLGDGHARPRGASAQRPS